MKTKRAYRSCRTALSLLAALALTAGACDAQAPAAQDPAAAFYAGRYDEAIRGYERLLEGDPADVAARRGLVRALLEVGRYEEAEQAAEDAGPELANLLGEALYARGELAGAEAAFRSAAEGDAPGRLAAELNLAVLLYNRGDRDEAMRRFDGFIDVYNGSESLSSGALTAIGSAVRYLGVRDPQLFRDALKAFDEAAAGDPRDPEPRVRVGELFLEKYNSPDAQASFAQVLAVNPRHPRALLGMARAKSFDGSPESLDLVRRSLAVNPNLVPARVLLARLYLDREDDAAAEVELREALEVNPSSLEALSVLAALHLLRDDRSAYEEVRGQVLRLNPRHAEFYSTVSELAVRYRRYREATELARQAVALDPESWSALGLLGLNQMRLGQVDTARVSLERSFTGDPYNVWIKNTLDLLDTFSRYETRRTPRFELVLRGDEADLLFPYAADLADEAYDELVQRYGYRPEGPVRVEFYPSHADFSVRTVGMAGLGALGVSFGNVLAMDSPSARERGEFNWGTTLWHELAHAITLGLSNHRVPRWLTEGLSVLEERRARPGWGADVTLDFLGSYLEGELPKASELNEGFVRPASPQHLGYAYFQASMLAEWIEEKYGFDAVLALLRGYGKGRSTEQLIRSVLRTEPDRLDQDFDAWLRTRFATQIGGLRSLTGRNAEESFAAQMAAAQRFLEDGRQEEAVRALRRAAELFPDYAGSDSPYAQLADIYERQGDPRAAADELARLTAIDENAYDANLKLSELLQGLGDATGAAAALERAVYIYPYEVPLHSRLAELYSELGDREGVVRERRAVVALQPVDRAEALYQLALALEQAGDRPGARREVLRALESAPSFAKAQELLLRLSGSSEEEG